jgi:hypothetical protein
MTAKKAMDQKRSSNTLETDGDHADLENPNSSDEKEE